MTTILILALTFCLTSLLIVGIYLLDKLLPDQKQPLLFFGLNEEEAEMYFYFRVLDEREIGR